MRIPRKHDPWASHSDSIQFSIPSCVENFAGLVPQNARVVEVGCGYGRVVRDLRDQGFMNVIGYDSSASMIKRGIRENPNLTLKLNEGVEIPEPDGGVDAVVCCAVLTCIPDNKMRMRVIGEIERVLRPGGVVHLVEFAESGSRSYDAHGRFRSGLGIEMVHFTCERLLAELGSFQKIEFREITCKSISGSDENALLFQGKKKMNLVTQNSE